jgi:hypothetical protein
MSDEIMSLEFPGDPTKLPTSRELPLGVLEFEIKGFQIGATSDVTHNKKKVTVQLIVAAPEEARGVPAFHDFIIGSDTDPAAKEKATWDKNAWLLMQMLKESGVVMSPHTRFLEAVGASTGNHVLGSVLLSKGNTDKDGRTWPDKHVIRRFHRVGSKPVGIRGENELAAMAPIEAANPTAQYENVD